MPNKHSEFVNIESNNWVGYCHHRWIFTVANEELRFIAKFPLVNAFSRRIEREADDFALRLTRDPNGFIAAMERLATLNLAERRPHPLKEALLFSHPALDRRIARARAVA